MRPLTADDLLPLDEYARRRDEFFRAHARYLDRYRRARLGPRLTLVFENRQTLWFRLQEVLLTARLRAAGPVQSMLDWFNRLLPRRGRLQAALAFDPNPTADFEAEEAFRRAIAAAPPELRLDGARVPTVVVAPVPEDVALGAACWLEFPLSAVAGQRLADLRRSAFFAVSAPGYVYDGPPLPTDFRQSLGEDLAAAERDSELAA